jgi:hypothetical protein
MATKVVAVKEAKGNKLDTHFYNVHASMSAYTST